MRIRKRQPVVVLETAPSSSHLERPLSPEGQGQFLAANGCWPREHQHEGINKEFAKQDGSPVTKFEDYSQFQTSQSSREEAQTVDYLQAETMPLRKERTGRQTGRRTPDDTHKLEVKTDDTHPKHHSLELEEDAGRVRGIKDTVRLVNKQIQLPRDAEQWGVEKDLNHPSNKPKESLLYSLYCVFSRLSGKNVLTAREALSKIIEEGLPGLDEGTGLHSVQVAKVMRSNPYFVHLEGGKFLLCSGPSPRSKEQLIHGPDIASAAMDSTLSQQPSVVANGTGRRDRDEEPQDYAGVRNKRARSKSSSNNSEMWDKTEGNLRPEEGAKISTSKTQISTSPKMDQGDDVAVQICKRYDGRGWKCHERALEGYSMCRHHHELIVNRLARLRSSGRLGSKKSLKRRKSGGKQVNEGACETEAKSNKEQGGAQWRKNVKARSLKSINT